MSADKQIITENTTDGFHTFKELYRQRLLYNAAFFNLLVNPHNSFKVHKSEYHSDGKKCFGGGWFIVMANLPTGQISQHYELGDWNLFKVQTRNKARKWDGHTPEQAMQRLEDYLKEASNG